MTARDMSFPEIIDDLQRRLARLENLAIGRPASRVEFVNDDDLVVGLLGRLGDGSWGIELTADAGNLIYQFTNAAGQAFPGIALPFVPTQNISSAGVAVTSATFLDVFNRSMDVVTADAINVIVPWTTGAGTTGEIRLSNNIGGGAVSDVVSLAANTSGYATFAWLHQQQLGSGPFEPAVQVRRTAGANNVTVWQPGLATMIDGGRVGATVSGV